MAVDKFRERIKEVMTEELAQPEKFWWLSFADDGFKGAVIIKAHGISDALMKCNMLMINPGGEVYAIQIPDDKEENFKLEDTNRLLSKEEIKKKWGVMKLGEME